MTGVLAAGTAWLSSQLQQGHGMHGCLGAMQQQKARHRNRRHTPLPAGQQATLLNCVLGQLPPNFDPADTLSSNPASSAEERTGIVLYMYFRQGLARQGNSAKTRVCQL